MIRKHCVGILVKDRWDLTQKTLQSLFHTDQLKTSYDLFLINNGSTDIVSQELTEWVKSSIIPVKNMFRTKSLNMGPAWNLFLSITKDYQFRTIIDNDIIFANTPITTKSFERVNKQSYSASPGNAGINPGAIPNASIVMGSGHTIKKHKNSHTCFLVYTENTIKESDLGICSIPPVSVGNTLVDTIPRLGRQSWRENPVLVGGCVTITKRTLETLGYFDEKLPCHIDWEYSQRAMAAGINVGYVPNYCVIHVGENNPTCSPEIRQKNETIAKIASSKISIKRDFVHTKWEEVNSKIMRAIKKNIIINIK